MSTVTSSPVLLVVPLCMFVLSSLLTRTLVPGKKATLHAWSVASGVV